jgi:hypothetical protein
MFEPIFSNLIDKDKKNMINVVDAFGVLKLTILFPR